MKNSLELEIVAKIKKANQNYATGNYAKALEGYMNSLELYHGNKIYNNAISQDYECNLYSLIGLTHISLENFYDAEESLNCSLKLQPNNSTCLIRRAKVFLKVQRLSESIEDLERAYVYEPDNKNLQELITQIKAQVELMEDQEEKSRLEGLMIGIVYGSEELNEQLEDEKLISFSHLKQIDRPSIQRRLKKKSSIFSQFRGEDDADSDSEDIPVTIISKSKMSTNSDKKAKYSLLRLQSFDQSNDEEQKQRHNLTAHRIASVESIEKPLQSNSEKARSSVRFVSCRDEDFEQAKLAPPSRKHKDRKSCLRTSKIVKNIEQQAIKQSANRRSTLLNIKNIDGPVIRSRNSARVETEALKSNQIGSNSIRNDGDADISSSDSEVNEHSIYGNGYRTSKALLCIQNLSHWSEQKLQNGAVKKKNSILKKESLVESSKGIRRERNSKKKSVCFLEGEKVGQLR